MVYSNIFRNKEAEAFFNANGFVATGAITPESVRALLALNRNLSIPDFYGCGYNCGMNSNLVDKRLIMQREIKALMTPFIQEHLLDFDIYTATFVNKINGRDCLVRAHQDFSYTDETQWPSFMCFIPLVDVTIKNAALGFIPGSHLYSDRLRAFPFPFGKTAVSENELQLMNYLEVLPLKAGQMVFFNQNTIHGSFSNYGDAERIAISFSLHKKDTPYYAYLHNPANNGRTILKYQVDDTFIARYHNPTIQGMFESGNWDIPYPLLQEIPYDGGDTSWSAIEKHLVAGGRTANRDYARLVARHQLVTGIHKTKDFLYNISLGPLKTQVNKIRHAMVVSAKSD